MKPSSADAYQPHFPHGLMFHHFHDDRHPLGQGSLSAEDFAAVIEFLGPHRLLTAEAWLQRHEDGSLRSDDMCLTFDDGLRCQFDVARPVLEAYGLTGFWFVYSSTLDGTGDRLEIFRHFRTVCFADFEAFYQAFLTSLEVSAWASEIRDSLSGFEPAGYLREFAFYTDHDRTFRYLRDQVLGPERFFAIMDGMMDRAGYDRHSAHRELWIDREGLLDLEAKGHLIGLHSHSHPTRLADLPEEAQLREYAHNKWMLENILQMPVRCTAHPCGSYGPETLNILAGLGVVLGFASHPGTAGHGPLAMPREDSANLMLQMGRRHA